MKRLTRWLKLPAPTQGVQQAPLRVRLLWMVAIWSASVLVLLALATVIRVVLKA